MKRILAAAFVVGLVAVPSLVAAQHGADNTNKATTNVRREDRRQNTVAQTGQTNTTAMTQTDDANRSTSVDNDDATPATTTVNTTLTLDEAKATAQAAFPQKTITKVELENEEGVQVFSVRFSDGSRVDVNASTGVIAEKRDATTQKIEDNDGDSHRGGGSGHDNSGSGSNNSGSGHSEDD